MKYELTLTEEQARIVAVACEFYARIRMGQFKEIIWNTLDMALPADDYCERRDAAESLLFEARNFIYPELHSYGHSYGMGKFDDADMAFDVYQVLREKWGDPRGIFSYHELPTVKVIKEENDASDKNRK